MIAAAGPSNADLFGLVSRENENLTSEVRLFEKRDS
jgi:hypothetical protein